MRVPPIVRNRLGRFRGLTARWTRLHAWLLRKSRGRLRFGFFFAGDMPLLALTTTGRKSGRPCSTVVGYLREGDSYVVCASNAGNDRTPGWWLNLQANPEGEVDAGGEHMRVRARRAEPDETERIWPRLVEADASFEAYRDYTERDLPVVVLEPRQG